MIYRLVYGLMQTCPDEKKLKEFNKVFPTPKEAEIFKPYELRFLIKSMLDFIDRID